jgi:hypothetical protein
MCTKCKHQSSTAPLFVTHNDTKIERPDHLQLQGYISGTWDKLNAKFGDVKSGLLEWDVLFEDGTLAVIRRPLATNEFEIYGRNYRAVELVKKALFGG